MKNSFLLLFYLGIYSCQGVVADDDLLVKKGHFPYMAYIYYEDPSVVDDTGSRFVRSAVLIRGDWLVTSALGPSVIDNNGFPKKTLMARVGAVTIDSNFTLNEDEDEQEREVIQIVRPYNHSATQWWTTDISLMKTLLPFNITSAVAIKSINVKRTFAEKTCIILVYAKKYANRTDHKTLMQLFVDVLPATMENCGHLFSGSSMTCATDSDENKDAVYDPNFCQGNSGGPLICEGEVMGIQSYIGNDCQQPHLYQLMSAWDDLITCGIEDKCMEEQCGKICDVTHKDPIATEAPAMTLDDNTNSPTPTELTPTTVVHETMTSEGEIAMTSLIASVVDKEIATETTSTERLTPTLTASYSETTETVPAPWPKEKTEERKKLVEEVMERNANVEAQQEEKRERSASEINMCFVQTIVFGLILCLF